MFGRSYAVARKREAWQARVPSGCLPEPTTANSCMFDRAEQLGEPREIGDKRPCASFTCLQAV